MTAFYDLALFISEFTIAETTKDVTADDICDLLWAKIGVVARVKTLPFYGHSQLKSGPMTTACLSQFFPATFRIGDIVYKTSEQFMMSCKARICGDSVSLEKILAAPTPTVAKATGRKITPYDDVAWGAVRYDCVVFGNYHKFSSNPGLSKFLIDTGIDTTLVEAVARDKIWGIGLGIKTPIEILSDPKNWKGQNLLGFALMSVRKMLIDGSPAPICPVPDV